MTREEMISWLKKIEKDIFVCSLESTFEEDAKSCAIHEAISALQTEPCEDVISRQAVLEQTYNWSKDEFLRVTNPFDHLRKRINSLPSVQPEPFINKPCVSEQACREDKMKVLEKIKAEIDEARYIDKDTRFCKNVLASGLDKALEIIDKYIAESEEV